jgi:hypothetical protein
MLWTANRTLSSPVVPIYILKRELRAKLLNES